MSQGRRNAAACGVCLALFLACGLAEASDVAGAASASTPKLKLVMGTYELGDSDNLLVGLRAQGEAPVHGLIAIDGPMTPERHQKLEAAGVQVGEYLPDFAFVADLSRADMAQLGGLGFVGWAGSFKAEWKVSPDLGLAVRESDPMLLKIQAQGQLAVHAWLFPGADRAQTLAQIAQIPGVTIVADSLEGDMRLVQLTAPRGLIGEQLAEIDGVRWVEEAPELTLRNNTSRWVVQSNVSNFYPVYDHGIRGEGQLIGLMDGKPNPNHCSFSDPEGDPFGPNHRKIEAYNTTTGSDTHGTHTAGTSIGDAGVFDDTRGVAYMARLVFGNIPSFSDTAMYNRLAQHYGQGATVHSNSWGNDGTTSYDGLCRGIDRFSYDNDDNLVCFAETNQSTLRNPENAKNLMAVAACGDAPSQNSFCSGGVGPTNDGRRKPEIMAPGCGIRSSNGSGCSTVALTGTSMACPHINACAALVRQYFMDGFYPSGAANANDAFTPSGPLMKAMLLNSGQDVTGLSGYPSTREGWGRVKLDEVLVFDDPGAETIIVRDVRNNSGDSLSTGDVIEVPFEVTDNLSAIRVTLVWHDPPAAMGANPAAVNNLDLEVVTPATTYLGNVFSAGGSSTPGGSADPSNNVEMVHTIATSTGMYTARVKATAVNSGSQGYALVIRGKVNENFGPQPCNGADLAEPYEQLDFSDVTAFLVAFGSMQPEADLAAPFGQWDFSDVTAFLVLFGGGCP
ncbi:MAG: S8 family serine peptidase [Phycisphaerales bacterium]